MIKTTMVTTHFTTVMTGPHPNGKHQRVDTCTNCGAEFRDECEAGNIISDERMADRCAMVLFEHWKGHYDIGPIRELSVTQVDL